MSKASVYFTVKDINGKHATKELKRVLDQLHGVISVSVNENAESVAVDFDTTGVEQERIKTEIVKLGYDITDIKFENHIM